MKQILDHEISRRALLASGGALVVSFSLLSPARLFAQEPASGPELPGSLADSPMLDSWIRIDADGKITVFTGKAELGQGIKTALIQVAAEELFVAPGAITLITADTGRTPDERYTAGSQSMQDSGTAILHAAAQVRNILLGLAAQRLNAPVERLKVENAAVVAEDGRKLGYGELVSEQALHVPAQPQSRLKDPSAYTVMGKSLPRVDIPGKVTGGVAYVHDLRMPGMAHARVVRPPSYGARLMALETADVEKMPGVLKIVRDGNFLAVIAEREFQAVQAMRALALAATWEERPTLPDRAKLFSFLQSLPAQTDVIRESRNPAGPAAKTVEARYQRAYQMHAAIGPSCAVGLSLDGMVTIWSHTQGVYPLRRSIAEMLRLPEDRVRCIHMEGSGCYGHNGADDAGADAALIAVNFPGRPVRVQWMREQEHAWEPYGSAMVTQARASLDAGGNIVDWQYEVWSHAHSTRPGGAQFLAPAWHLQNPFKHGIPEPIPQPTGGGDRNSIPLYDIPNMRIVSHFLPDMPLRVSALRALGGYMNVFSLESFMDELAAAAGADPIEFRLRHLKDQRARDVVTTVADRFGWKAAAELPRGRGRGFAFARYKNLAAYNAVAVEVEVEHETGRARVVRAVAAIDSGQVANPDGMINQTEGGIVQSSSWTLHEAVTFDDTRITSIDWSTYPILRFSGVPESIEVHVINRPGEPFLGTGEAAQGPTAAAIGNAIANATGARLRELPLTPDRIKAAIGV